MTIRYTNTVRDMLAFTGYTYSRNRVMQILLTVLLLWTTWQGISRWSPEHGAVVNVLSILIVELTLIGIPLLLTIAITTLLFSVGRNKTLMAEHTVTLTPDELVESTAYNSTVQNWDAVVRVARTRKHLFIYTSELSGHVIPRRALESEQDWDALYELVNHAVASA